ncbi:hypothetical protein I553_5025 [Mycobacterium xenopi 4042]|uniref:Uncharacterized protein n=1 Tax=Mycobacterium xenopi 4042 TaxID=1299334 RepID=X7ZWR8_MYCXE|nr:hypothetical protein I553_5025 [Mycobacterium xenopi 4042]
MLDLDDVRAPVGQYGAGRGTKDQEASSITRIPLRMSFMVPSLVRPADSR